MLHSVRSVPRESEREQRALFGDAAHCTCTCVIYVRRGDDGCGIMGEVLRLRRIFLGPGELLRDLRLLLDFLPSLSVCVIHSK